MDDLISRQALMKEFADFVRASNNSDFAKTPTWNDAVSLVGSMPSAQQEQQWIPVSERLPEQDQICLICGKNGGVYVARFWKNETLILWTKTGTGKFVKAVAWMPLPEPYKGEES